MSLLARLRFGLLERADTVSHWVGLPADWLCDRLDLAYGVTKDELRRTGPKLPSRCPHVTYYSGVSDVTCGCGAPVVVNQTAATGGTA